jgi:hypothetical protein
MMQDQKIEKGKKVKKKTLVLISLRSSRGFQTICRGGDSAFSRGRFISISEQFAKDSAFERERERFISISEQFVEDSAFERETDS